MLHKLLFRLRKYEEALAQAEQEKQNKIEADMLAMSLLTTPADGVVLSEKETLKLKKKQEKEAQKEFERKQEEERQRLYI